MRWLHTLWWFFPHGPEARKTVGVIMFITGVGRLLGLASPATCYFTPTFYGWLLTIFGICITISTPNRLSWWGRALATLAAGLLTLMATDLWPATVSLYLVVLKLIMFREAGSRDVYI